MKRTKNVLIKNGLLKWLTKTILVLGLTTFSGHVPEFRPYIAEPTNTELNEVRRVSSKRTVSLKRVFDALNCSLLHSTTQSINFTSCLLHQENSITVKLKNNFKELPSNEKDGFLVFYSAESAETFHTYQLRG